MIIIKIIDYVYKKEFSSPNYLIENGGEFIDKQDIIDWIPISYCPTRFIEDFAFYQPIKKGNSCAVSNKSENQQRKLCKECWNREYVNNTVQEIDYKKQIETLIQRYKNKIKWLENNKNSKNINDVEDEINYIAYSESINTFETVIHDLEELLLGIDM